MAEIEGLTGRKVEKKLLAQNPWPSLALQYSKSY